MSKSGFFGKRVINVPCTLEIEHSAQSLHAHVVLGADYEVGPGDIVQVEGAPVNVPFGEKLVLQRRANITFATPIERAWTRLTARFELTELFEVSFSTRRKL